MDYSFYAFLSITLFACVHLLAEKTRVLDSLVHGRFLSTGSGVAIAYVFIDLLPKLEKNHALLKTSWIGGIPYFEKHVYVLALLGFLLFYTVDRSGQMVKNRTTFFYISLSSYTLFNFLMGYAVADPFNPEVRPLALFTFAIALHYFANDYTLSLKHGTAYHAFGKWVLAASLYLGWIVGYVSNLPANVIALVSAFIGGGVIMNVMLHELLEEKLNSSGTFLIACISYTLLLLFIGTSS